MEAISQLHYEFNHLSMEKVESDKKLLKMEKRVMDLEAEKAIEQYIFHF